VPEIKNLILRQEMLEWRKLKPFQPKNLKVLTKSNYERLRESLRKNNFIAGFHVWEDAGEYWILDGHHRKYALEDFAKDGYVLPEKLPCSIVDVQSKQQAIEFLLTYSSEYAHPDPLGISEFVHLNGLDFENLNTFVDLRGVNLIELKMDNTDAAGQGIGNGSLADRFLVPPFSVLDARQGYWQDRKRSWLELGIKSELGRGDNLLGFSETCKLKKSPSNKLGKCLETGIGEKYGREEMNGTSIFDPVLCELAYRWFSPKGGTVLDPFAGGSVRGIIAAKCGRQYIGVDLRKDQVEANRIQWGEVSRENDLTPIWQIGDSRHIGQHAAGVKADFIFSCPPYADLEVYSDDPADISTMDYPQFLAAYREIIANSCNLLKDDRFACFVVGDVRAKDGTYKNFVSETISAFLAAGLQLYNEAILVTCLGTVPIRAGNQFIGSRKLGKTHQNVLVFVKGDPKVATAACGEIEVYDPTAENIAS
jgi:hypothetical protein